MLKVWTLWENMFGVIGVFGIFHWMLIFLVIFFKNNCINFGCVWSKYSKKIIFVYFLTIKFN